MPKLTDRKIKSFAPGPRAYKRYDELGLTLIIKPSGKKVWHFRYRRPGGQNQLSLGHYPQITLSAARAARDELRRQIANGKDPSVERRKSRLIVRSELCDSLENIADAFIEKERRSNKAPATIKKLEFFRGKLVPSIGPIPIKELEAPDLLGALKPLEAAGQFETLKKTRSFAERVWNFAIAEGRAIHNPAQNLRGAFATGVVKHHAAPLVTQQLRDVLIAIEGYENPIVRAALQLIAQTYVRPGTLRSAEWNEFDLEKRVWRVPASNMKGRKAFDLPLSLRSIEILSELKRLTGNGRYVFPSAYGHRRPMSENTMNAALRRMGFGKEVVTAHGFRAVASTHLNEQSPFSPDAIEISLAHRISASVRTTYHRGTHWEERVALADWWSHYLRDIASD